MSSNLAVIIPMYNESRGAEKCVRAVLKAIDPIKQRCRLFVVNDGSRDATPAILNELLNQELNFEFVDLKENGGYGAALLAGAKRALADGFDFGLFMDSDLTNDPRDIATFLAKIDEGQFDLIKASRYIPGGAMEGVPAKRQRISRLGNRVASLLFGMGIRDCTNGFRAVRLSMLDQLKFHERGFAVIVEELYLLKKLGARATEIPNVLKSRGAFEGDSKFQYTPKTFYRYFKYALKARFG